MDVDIHGGCKVAIVKKILAKTPTPTSIQIRVRTNIQNDNNYLITGYPL